MLYALIHAAVAATIPVCSGCSVTSVPDAVAVAVDGDVIDVQDGVWYGRVEVIGKSITIRGQGTNRTAIDGDRVGTVVEVSGGGALVLQDLAVRGSAMGNGTITSFGVYARDADLTMRRVVVHGNGCGVWATGSTVDIEHSVVADNLHDGISINTSDARVVQNTIVGNGDYAVSVGNPSGQTTVVDNNLLIRNGRGAYFGTYGTTASTRFNMTQDNGWAGFFTQFPGDWQRVSAASGVEGFQPDVGTFEGEVDWVSVGCDPYVLGPLSDAIAAGDPAILNEDGSRSHIGATGGFSPASSLSTAQDLCLELEVDQDWSAGTLSLMPTLSNQQSTRQRPRIAIRYESDYHGSVARFGPLNIALDPGVSIGAVLRDRLVPQLDLALVCLEVSDRRSGVVGDRLCRVLSDY